MDQQWQSALRDYGWSSWRVLGPHRWIAPVLLERSANHPVNQLPLSWIRSVLTDAGYRERDANLALGFWHSFLMGSLFARAALTSSGRGSGGPNRADEHFAFGLEGVLSAIERLPDTTTRERFAGHAGGVG